MLIRNSVGQVPATEIAIDRVAEDENVERLVIVITDANFNRYRISSDEVSRTMRKLPHVNTHMVMIAGLRDEAEEFARELPVGKAHVSNHFYSHINLM